MHTRATVLIAIIVGVAGTSALSRAQSIPGLPKLPTIDIKDLKKAAEPKPRTEHERSIRDFEHRHFRAQQNDVWCWLACAEMIHHHAGRRSEEYTQEGLARTIYGIEDPNSPQARAGAYLHLLRALSPRSKINVEGLTRKVAAWVVEDEDAKRKAVPDPSQVVAVALDLTDGNAELIIDELSRGKPVVALLKPQSDGQSGHAVVLYGVRWQEGGASVAGLLDGGKGRQILSVDVADPDPDDRTRIKMLTGEQLKMQANDFLSERRARELLEGINKAANAPGLVIPK